MKLKKGKCYYLVDEYFKGYGIYLGRSPEYPSSSPHHYFKIIKCIYYEFGGCELACVTKNQERRFSHHEIKKEVPDHLATLIMLES